MTVVDDIKDRLDIVEIVGQTVKLRRTGKNYIGFCPFHSNTRTPAFVVFPETQTWRCFGQCNEGGDIFGYMMKREGWDFNEACAIWLNALASPSSSIPPKPRPMEKPGRTSALFSRKLPASTVSRCSRLLRAIKPLITFTNEV